MYNFWANVCILPCCSCSCLCILILTSRKKSLFSLHVSCLNLRNQLRNQGEMNLTIATTVPHFISCLLIIGNKNNASSVAIVLSTFSLFLSHPCRAAFLTLCLSLHHFGYALYDTLFWTRLQCFDLVFLNI